MKIIVLVALMLASQLLLAGGADTAGGDHYDFRTNSMWFQAPGTIEYCLEMSEDFGLQRDVARAGIEKAHRIWMAYLSRRPKSYRWTNWESSEALEKGLFKHDLALVECTDNPDLTFYLGRTSADVQRELGKLDKPIALAHRQWLSKAKQWGQGFVWFARSGSISSSYPDWTRKNAFLTMALHEWGHVYGSEHVENTIMRRDINATLRQASIDDPQIEQGIEAEICLECAYTGHRLSRVADESLQRAILTLTGRRIAIGESVETSLELAINDGALIGEVEIVVGGESHKLPVNVGTRHVITNAQFNQPLLKYMQRSIVDEELSYSSAFSNNAPMVLSGSIVPKSGQKHTLTLAINSGEPGHANKSRSLYLTLTDGNHLIY